MAGTEPSPQQQQQQQQQHHHHQQQQQQQSNSSSSSSTTPTTVTTMNGGSSSVISSGGGSGSGGTSNSGSGHHGSSSMNSNSDFGGLSANDDQLACAPENSLFSLKWNEFDKQLALGFSNLYQTQELADVTICCDGKSAQAHKIVLAMCSPYFRQIFKDHPCQHPVVIIKGIKSHQLQLVLQFIYFGQVSVEKREIQNFIEAAELLKIDGISANEPQQYEYGGGGGSSRNNSTIRQPLLRPTESTSKLAESFLRSSRSGYPPTSVLRSSPHERWTSSGTPEMHSPASSLKAPSDINVSASHGNIGLSGRRHSSRSSDGSGGGGGGGNYSEGGPPHLASVIRNAHMSSSSSWTSQSRQQTKDGLISPKSMRGSPPTPIGSLSGIPPMSPVENRREMSSAGVRLGSPPFLEPPLPVMVNLEESPDEYITDTSPGGIESGLVRGEGEYELSIRPVSGLPLPYSKAFKTSSGIVSASMVKSLSPRRLPTNSPTSSTSSLDVPDPIIPHEILHSPTVVPAKKRFSHLSHGLRYSPVDQEQSLVIRPVYSPVLLPPPGPTASSSVSSPMNSSNASSAGPSNLISAGIGLLGGPSLSSSSSKVRAHRQSQVPLSARYTSAQVDAIVDSVTDHSGPCVPCKICDKWVKRERLRAHIHECHLVHGEKIICPHCGVALKSKGSYRVHVWRHRRGVLARGLKTKRVLGAGQRPTVRIPTTTTASTSQS